ncbi:DUF2846 domain-containing protein [Sphingomonas bacterium]|uniref:DUF2846 domain-containing protein n=1 Tax=Sphingomonas bacterium TaxID=1895847 RepID=UPI00261997AB|nr:DUF2846 domain-containing protein [Sphingomonas bacterium]MDB5678548.1 hypothetical protein [Sphingomonas bacterium]
MRTKSTFAALAATALTLTAVAPTALAQDAPIVTKSATIGAPPAGMGQIIFFRPGSIMGAALGCTVHENGKEVARLGSGKYYLVIATPGKHLYNTQAENVDQLTLEVEAGETYFVKCKVGMGVVAGRPNLSPADRATFEKKAKGMASWTPKEKKGDDAK